VAKEKATRDSAKNKQVKIDFVFMMLFSFP